MHSQDSDEELWAYFPHSEDELMRVEMPNNVQEHLVTPAPFTDMNNLKAMSHGGPVPALRTSTSKAETPTTSTEEVIVVDSSPSPEREIIMVDDSEGSLPLSPVRSGNTATAESPQAPPVAIRISGTNLNKGYRSPSISNKNESELRRELADLITKNAQKWHDYAVKNKVPCDAVTKMEHYIQDDSDKISQLQNAITKMSKDRLHKEHLAKLARHPHVSDMTRKPTLRKRTRKEHTVTDSEFVHGGKSAAEKKSKEKAKPSTSSRRKKENVIVPNAEASSSKRTLSGPGEPSGSGKRPRVTSDDKDDEDEPPPKRPGAKFYLPRVMQVNFDSDDESPF
ncbi:hypothetical protein BC629DRAFT_1556930 [Irpex lacteus]|nr:hypothetical protein BC629DRAFT_1556930 [Irpex lacteus]